MIGQRYIEVIGLPGAGKTEAAKLLADILKNKEKNAVLRAPINPNPFEKLRIVLGVVFVFLQTPSLVNLWFFRPKGEYGSMSGASAVVKNMRWRLVAEVAIVRRLVSKDQNLLINDEGIIGKMVVLSLLTGFREDMVVGLLNKILPKYTFILHINTPNTLSIKRVADRKIALPCLDDMSGKIKISFYQHNAEVYSRVCASLENSSEIEVGAIKNAGNRDDLKVELEKVSNLIV